MPVVQPILQPLDKAPTTYDAVTLDYAGDADGEESVAIKFSGRFGFADREIWHRIDAELVALRAAGRLSVRVVDLGCGAGTWLIRTACRARALGFTAIEARGFDLSPAMIALAMHAAKDAVDPAIDLCFSAAGITDALASEAHPQHDITLCLGDTMNHLPRSIHVDTARALVAAGQSLFVTARTVGSPPSLSFTDIENAREFRYDWEAGWLDVDLVDGRHFGFPSHLFSSDELQTLFSPYGQIVERMGLDLFHGRFAADRRWHPPSLPGCGFDEALIGLEHLCARDPRFIDRAAHILLHVRAPMKER